MSEKEQALEMLRSLPDEALDEVIGFMEDLTMKPSDPDPFYGEQNMRRLQAAARKMDAVARA